MRPNQFSDNNSFLFVNIIRRIRSKNFYCALEVYAQAQPRVQRQIDENKRPMLDALYIITDYHALKCSRKCEADVRRSKVYCSSQQKKSEKKNCRRTHKHRTTATTTTKNCVGYVFIVGLFVSFIGGCYYMHRLLAVVYCNLQHIIQSMPQVYHKCDVLFFLLISIILSHSLHSSLHCNPLLVWLAVIYYLYIF